MKVLFVTPWVPWRIRARANALLSVIASDNEVRVLALSRKAQESKRAAELPARVQIRTVLNGQFGSILRVIAALPTSRPLQIAYANPSSFRAALRDEVRFYKPDLVHFNVARTSHLTSLVDGVPWVLDMDDIRSAYFYQLSQSTHRLSPWRAIAPIEGLRLGSLETKLMSGNHPLLFSSAFDARKAATGYTVHTPLDVLYWSSFEKETDGRPTLLFVGRLHYRANRDAISWFLREILPPLVDRFPDLLFHIVGEDPPRSVRAFASEHVTVQGFQADIRPAYSSATIAVVPVRAATGVQLKLLQAMAAGVPAITFSAIAQQVGADESHLMVADTIGRWISSIASALEDPSTVLPRVARAQALIAAEFSPESARRQLSVAYLHALG